METKASLIDRWKRIPQGIRFLAIGGWNTVFGLAAFAALHAVFAAHCHYLVLLGIANELAIINAYIAYKFAVFNRGSAGILGEILRFHSVYAFSAILGMALTYALVERLSVHPVAAQCITLVVTVVCSFFAHRSYSFRAERPPKEG